MADLVRVRINGFEKNVGRAFAEIHDLEVLDQLTHRRDGSPRPATRAGSRPRKPKTSVAQEAAKRKSAATEAVDDDNPTPEENA